MRFTRDLPQESGWGNSNFTPTMEKAESSRVNAQRVKPRHAGKASYVTAIPFQSDLVWYYNEVYK